MAQIEDRVFIRKLNKNELGFKDGHVGAARGPAILVSKNLNGFFPPLSDNIFNDSQPVSLCIEGSKKSVLLNFIYFNGKRVYGQANGRDEKRIYISKEHYDFFFPGDFFIFYKVKAEQDVYFFVRRIKQNSPHFINIEEMAKSYKLDSKGNHLEVKREAIDALIGKPTLPDEVEDEIDDSVIKALGQMELELESQDKQRTRARPRIDLEKDDDLELFENSSFRKLVLFFYGKKCAISSHNIIFKKSINLEAAHIHWHAEGGVSHPSNGIPLCRDLHWAFDRGMFTINLCDDGRYRVEIHKDMKDNDYLSKYDGQDLRLPHDQRYLPRKEHLEWHRQHIYGKFCR